jgi:long-chain acyl-CoA synthetase
MGSVGIPVPGVELKIIDENENEVEQGSPGQIIVRGPQVMKGYYKQPEETAKFIKNGWFYTGDLGSIDEDGFVYHLGRADEVIITGGLNVYPAEVENFLLSHDNIMEAAVLGVDDEMRGKVLSAFVVKRADSDISEKDVIKFLRENVADYKVPKIVSFIDSLPMVGPGKIDKKALAEASA